MARMQKGRLAAQQGRIDTFFTMTKMISSEPTQKRKVDEKPSKEVKKRGPNLSKKVKGNS